MSILGANPHELPEPERPRDPPPPAFTREQEREIARIVKAELDLIACRVSNSLRAFAGMTNL